MHTEPDFPGPVAEWCNRRSEIKGFEDDQIKAKHTAAKRWVEA